MLAAPEATLGTLRELLTSHSNHLSELYASLGASEDVVPSKMRELHSALVSCIEEQSEQAKEEVAAVHKELEALQEELRALAGQLGTKLAPDPSDEPLVTTLANRREARQRLLDLRQERQNQAQQLVDSISELLPILDQSPPPLVSEKSLTLTRLKALQQLQSESQTELQRRADQLVETMAEAEGLQTDMDIEPDAVFLSLCAPDVQPTATNLEKAARLQDSLEEERSRREAFIQDTFDALFALWASMGVDEAEADGFVEEHAGITQECMDAYTAELDRMKQWRRENIGEWVRCEMLEVRKLQVALFLLPESALDDVMEEQVEEGSEEQVLEQLEEQKTDLQRQMDEKQKLLNMLTRYFSILQEAEELKVHIITMLFLLLI